MDAPGSAEPTAAQAAKAVSLLSLSEEDLQHVLGWVRPEHVPVPTVWGRHEYQGTRYRIQDASPEHHARMIELYAREYFPDEPASKNLGLADDETSAAEYSFLIAGALQQGSSLVVLEEAEGSPEPEIVGGMILPVLTIDDELPELEGTAMRVLLGMSMTLRASGDDSDPLHRAENPVKLHLADLGLWTRRDRRGRGLAEAVLRCVEPLCKALGVPHFSTLFTGARSQRLARKVGFKEMASIDYADILGEDGQPAFTKDMPEVSCKIMGMEVELEPEKSRT